MAELVFAKADAVLFRAPLNVRAFRVGANPLNDLTLADPAVAPFHLSVERTPEGYLLVDRSGAGTVVNGLPQQVCKLKAGDTLTLGGLTAVFEPGESAPSRTSVLPHNAPKPGASKLVFSDGRTVALTAEGVRVGKEDSNDVVLEDGFVSGFHALVFLRDGQVVVRDLGSTNGTFINAIRITEAEAPPDATVTFGQLAARVRVEGQQPRAARADGPVRSVGELIYADPSMEPVANAVRSVAAHEAPVCITGESGCGKELVARAIHQLGPRAGEPFVAVNCAALSPNLLESELFGHEKGAFTGADRARMGAFEEAGRGTLFLDEVGDLPAEAQAKLLRALENREVRRVGADTTRKVQCRVLCATHQNMSQRVAQGHFRNDLFHRLTVLPIRLPPLRERRADIGVLTEHFMKTTTDGSVSLSPAALERLKTHPFPGNVRELRNVLVQAVVFSNGKKTLGPEDLSFSQVGMEDLVAQARVYSPGRTLAEIELEAIEQAIEVHGSHVAAARELGIARSTLIARVQGKRKSTGK